ncbi:hypothetical protein ES703_09509 [subsurface metagenome]
MSDKRNMGGLLKLVILSVVGLSLTPSIQAQVTRITASGATGDLNLTLAGATRAIIGLFPLFWIILMVAIPVYFISIWLKT